MRRNYHRKLSASILRRGKCRNYRDTTGVSKNESVICSINYHKWLKDAESRVKLVESKTGALLMQKEIYNRETNSAAFCVIQRMSLKPPIPHMQHN